MNADVRHKCDEEHADHCPSSKQIIFAVGHLLGGRVRRSLQRLSASKYSFPSCSFMSLCISYQLMLTSTLVSDLGDCGLIMTYTEVSYYLSVRPTGIDVLLL